MHGIFYTDEEFFMWCVKNKAPEATKEAN